MNSKTKILFTIPNFITAGSGRAMLNIIGRLDRKKFSPAVCVMKKGGALDREVEKMRVPFLEAPFLIPAKPYLTLFWRARQATAVFKPYGFKLWHSFHYGDDYTEALIAWFADSKYVYTKKNMNWHRRSWYLRTLFASRVAFQNKDMMKNFFQEPWFQHKANLVARGVVTDRFRPGISLRAQLRERLKISAETPLLGCVANLVVRKGHSFLIEALAKVPDIHLVLAGKSLEPEVMPTLDKLAKIHGVENRVHFLGDVKDVPTFLAELDFFVLPTRASGGMEGSPVALLEAMACGLSCIASDIPGSRDIIQDGANGFLVPPENPDALAAKIRLLAQSEELRAKMGKAARQRILDHYTIEREVADHERLYQEILNGK